ncbi:hypothetical protein [Nonomuraea gerenzanensis]|uniref:Uncharacterized protein n=1 Tax=Nonomuraea gerenzanensis TaxID=93944 RepID=A0A1M4E6E7_9ACTN|nr:hypothetical protein [Nonomuraea gerenzanensis]UBU16716.1 hypothetical protein LCN96_17355 [Nonomuraea gerenzanensis]SBO94419.1 hypothetical protein BN4615_P3935 [Nonomuraea gerenzanensis]
MKKGINYDTGFLPEGGSSRKVFEAETVAREMRVIADELHCQVVRVSGRDPELLDLFEREGVETALWFTFAGYTRLGEADLGSYGVVRMLDETRWEPKEVFHAMAARYARS